MKTRKFLTKMILMLVVIIMTTNSVSFAEIGDDVISEDIIFDNNKDVVWEGNDSQITLENENEDELIDWDQLIPEEEEEEVEVEVEEIIEEEEEVEDVVESPFMDDHIEYIKGYVDGSIRPNAQITRAEVAAAIYRLLDPSFINKLESNKTISFNDTKNHWANKEINTLVKAGVLKGYEDGSFRPGNYITRAEVATIFTRFFNLEESSEEAYFSDINNHWAKEAIIQSANAGWINGYGDNTFKPKKRITRAEFVTLVNRVLERGLIEEDSIPSSIKTFNDLEKGQWYYTAMVEATNGHEYKSENGKEVWVKVFNLNPVM